MVRVFVFFLPNILFSYSILFGTVVQVVYSEDMNMSSQINTLHKSILPYCYFFHGDSNVRIQCYSYQTLLLLYIHSVILCVHHLWSYTDVFVYQAYVLLNIE